MTPPETEGDKTAYILKEMRAAGWRVGVHNDYMQAGILRTYWLMTHPRMAVFVKGEADTDLEALQQCQEQAAKIYRSP